MGEGGRGRVVALFFTSRIFYVVGGGKEFRVPDYSEYVYNRLNTSDGRVRCEGTGDRNELIIVGMSRTRTGLYGRCNVGVGGGGYGGGSVG